MSQLKKSLLIAVALLASIVAVAPAQAGDPCCDDVRIKYRYRPGVVCCNDGCMPAVTQVLCVKDPTCCGHTLEVPVCVPACCVGVPCVSSKVGLLAGHVWYEWECGYKVRVDIGKRKNNVVVTHFGL